MDAPLSYRSSLITGASSGLGYGLALWFARRGVRVYAAARRADRLEQLRAELPDRIVPVVLDVRDADATAARVAALDEESGGLDLVIANAGVSGGVPATRLNWPLSQGPVLVNVVGAVATLSAALPGMVARGRGHLVGMSSMAAFRGLPEHAGYSASKAYLATWLESVRLDLMNTPIRVTCIHPGFVKSEMTAKNKHKMWWLMDTDDAVRRMGKAIVAGKRVHRFPLPMSLLMRIAHAIPDALYDRIVRAWR